MTSNRLQKIKEQFKKYKIDSFVAFKKEHIRYLTSLNVSENLDAICIIGKSKSYILTDFRYEEKALELASAKLKVIIVKQEKIKEIARILKNSKNIGFDASLNVAYFKNLKSQLKNNKLIPINNLIENTAAIKEESEIKNIKKALRITEHVFEHHILPIIKIGIKELDLAAEITYQQKLHGAEADSFHPIVLSGARSSFPHGTPSNNKIKKGILQFDFGCVVNGYSSDFSRALIIGTPTKKQKEIYNIVLTAQAQAIHFAKPLAKYCDVDAIARSYITKQGYGKNFGHALGHGVGITCHAQPSVSQSSPDKMKPGHVVTIEPGIYLPDWGGIRIEDMILVKKDSIEVLSKSTKQMDLLNLVC